VSPWVGKTDKKIVRAKGFGNENSFFRTKYFSPFFMDYTKVPFRPKEIICFAHRIPADGSSYVSNTQGDVSDRSSRNFALG
jgi:hypothetical protein